MKNYYGASVRGYAHLKHGIPNQDAYLIKHLYDFDLMMVLDGVSLDVKGQVSKSEYASNYLKHRILKYITKHASYGMKMSELLELVKASFEATNEDLKYFAKTYGKKYNSSRLVLDYQTTLALVIHRNGDFVYGNAGDSGIIFEAKKGLKYFTNCIKENASTAFVEPLIVKDAWQFGMVIGQEVKYILMATDGIFDVLVPIKDCQNYNLNLLNKLFMVKSELKNYLESSKNYLTSDDKTVVILENENYRPYKCESDEERHKRESEFLSRLSEIINEEIGG